MEKDKMCGSVMRVTFQCILPLTPILSSTMHQSFLKDNSYSSSNTSVPGSLSRQSMINHASLRIPSPAQRGVVQSNDATNLIHHTKDVGARHIYLDLIALCRSQDPRVPSL
jgi:hypothetical protein